MPSGRTHDSITLWSLPLIAGATFERTHSASLTLILSGGYLFSGLMFGPDLDIHSQQYKRWGILRWIWLPYRRSMRHRSFLSHGVIVGTLIRIVYLLSWLLAALGLVGLLSAIAYVLVGEAATWMQAIERYWPLARDGVGRSLQHHLPEWFALLLGLELGACSHSLSDWLSSRYKQLTPRKPKPSRSLPASAPTQQTQPQPPPAPPAPSTPASPPSTVELPRLPPNSKLPPLKD